MTDLATFWATDNKEERKLQLNPANVNYFKKILLFQTQNHNSP